MGWRLINEWILDIFFSVLIKGGIVMEEFYVQELKREFARLRGLNKSYSMRSYASQLRLNPGSLSNILQGKRSLPIKYLEFICQKLRLENERKSKFIKSVYSSQGQISTEKLSLNLLKTTYLDEESHFKIISEWEHYAFLNLLMISTIGPKISWCAERLSLSEERLSTVIYNLLEAKLIELDPNGFYQRTKEKLKTSEDILSVALQRAHKKELELAYSKMNKVDIGLKDYSSIILPVNLKNISKAKKLIRQFRSQMETVLEDGEKEEVYQLSIQLFPLSNVNSREH